MLHKRGTNHSFFRLKQKTPAIPSRITGVFCLNTRKLNVFCPTLYNKEVNLSFSASVVCRKDFILRTVNLATFDLGSSEII